MTDLGIVVTAVSWLVLIGTGIALYLDRYMGKVRGRLAARHRHPTAPAPRGRSQPL